MTINNKNQKFSNIFVVCTSFWYITWQKQFKIWKVPTLVDSIMVVSLQTHCALLHSMCVLMTAQVNVQHNQISELILNDFKPGHNTVETSKNVCFTKGEGAVDHSIETRCLKNFAWVAKTLMIVQAHIGLKPLIPRPCSKPKRQIQWVALGQYQLSSYRPQTINSKAML